MDDATATLRALADRLGAQARALGALGAALRARVAGAPPDPALAPHLDAALAALGVRDAVAAADPAALRPLLGGIQTEIFLAARLASGEAGTGGGWSDTDPRVLRASGEVSAGFPAALDRAVAPRLAGLAERLAAPGAAFLDVGTGVGALAVAMARRWPALRVVGLDPLPAALALAREAVRAAGLGDRVALREGRAEGLTDEDAFDLAWVPGLFVAPAALPAVLARCARALRPGGWLLLAHADPDAAGDDPLAAALARLRAAAWGGAAMGAAEAAARLTGAGLAEVVAVPGPPGGGVAMAAGRRPVAGWGPGPRPA